MHKSDVTLKSSPKEEAELFVLERSPQVAARVGRILSAGAGLRKVVVASDPAALGASFGQAPSLLGCDVSDLELATEWARTWYPSLRILAWATDDTRQAVTVMAREQSVSGILGFGSFESAPRRLELQLAARRIVSASVPGPSLAELLGWGATVAHFAPKRTRDLSTIVASVESLSTRVGVNARVIGRVSEVAHELLMNAMYVAPVLADGTPRYAHARTADVELADAEIPSFQFGTDGVHLVLQVVDRFGRLSREMFLHALLRAWEEAAVDTKNGGAGLGLYRVYRASSALIVDVTPGRETSITAFFPVDIPQRDLRKMPSSLLYFCP